MLFRDVIGQNGVKKQLIEMVGQNRLSHALLFLGREGSGALPLALAFAQYISLLPTNQKTGEMSLFGEPLEMQLPEDPDTADAWMEKQPAFSKAAQMVHPDIHYSYPVITKTSGKAPLSTDYITEWREFIQQFPYGNIYDWLQFLEAENKQGNITANECNDIIHKLNLKSFESGYKVLLMWMPEYLGKEGNKLLKLIEEPPADTLFILVAENESKILSTILSRCQLVKVPALNPKDIEQRLMQKSNCTQEQARHLANASAGNFREALHLLQHADEDFYGLLKSWLNAIIKNQPVDQVKVIEELARLGREKQKQFIRYFIQLIEHAVRLEAGAAVQTTEMEQNLSSSELDFIGRLNKTATLPQKEAMAAELDNASYYIERNANAKILFHALGIRIFHIVKNNIRLTV